MRYVVTPLILHRHASAAPRLLAAAAALSLAVLPAQALVVNQWSGVATDNYNVASNWLQNRVPNSGDQATIYSGPVSLYASPVTVGGVLVSKIGSAGQLFTSSFKLTVSGTTAVDNGGQLYIQAVSGGSVGLQTGNLTLTSGSLAQLQFSNSNASVTGALSVDATSNLTTEGTLSVGGTLTNNGMLFNNGGTINANTFALVGSNTSLATIRVNGQALTINATNFSLNDTFTTIDASAFASHLTLNNTGANASLVNANVTLGDSAHLSLPGGEFFFGNLFLGIPSGSFNLNGGTTAAHAAVVDSYAFYDSVVNVTGFATMASGEFDGGSVTTIAAAGNLTVGSPYFRGVNHNGLFGAQTYSNISLGGNGTMNWGGSTGIGFSGSNIPYTAVSVANTTVLNWEGTSGANATLDIQNGELDIFSTSLQSRLVFSGFFFTTVNGYDGNITIEAASKLNVANTPWTLFGTMTLGPGAIVQGQTLTISGSSAPAGTYALYPTGSAGVFPTIQAPVILNPTAIVYLASGSGLNLNGNTTYAGGSIISAPYTIQPYGTMVQNGNATVSANTTLFCNTFDMDGTANNATWTINAGVTLTQQAWFLDAPNSTTNPVHSTINLAGTLDMETHSGQWTLAGGTLNATGASSLVQHDKLILGSAGAIGTINVVNSSAALFVTGGFESAATSVAGGNILNVSGYLVLSNSITFDANSVTTENGAFAFEIETAPTCGVGSVLNVNDGSAQFLLGVPGPANLSINVQGPGLVGLYKASNLKALHILAGGGAILPVGGTNTLFTNSLIIDGGATPTGALGITDNKVIVEAPLNHASILATLQAQAAYGSAHPLTNGIYDYYLPANYGMAVMDNAVLGKGTFGGLVVDANSILISRELLGDSNADGVVDLNDLNAVLNHLGVTTPAWTSGNFDGASTIDLNDLNDVLNNLGVHNANATVSSAESLVPASAPEPASLAMLCCGFTLLFTRRHPLSRQR